MSTMNSAWWKRAQAARDQLVASLIDHPAVSLIDIGLDPEQRSSEPVIRVHLRPSVEPPPIPEEVDGIDVRIVAGAYTPQSDVEGRGRQRSSHDSEER